MISISDLPFDLNLYLPIHHQHSLSLSLRPTTKLLRDRHSIRPPGGLFKLSVPDDLLTLDQPRWRPAGETTIPENRLFRFSSPRAEENLLKMYEPARSALLRRISRNTWHTYGDLFDRFHNNFISSSGSNRVLCTCLIKSNACSDISVFKPRAKNSYVPYHRYPPWPSLSSFPTTRETYRRTSYAVNEMFLSRTRQARIRHLLGKKDICI